MNKILRRKIDDLILETKTLNVLKDNHVLLINDLWQLSRTDLKEFGLLNEEINQIVIQLQLNGVDLNKKIYSRL